MMKRLLGDRRGVSPIVADLMLLVITVAAFSLMYGTSNQWISLQRVNQMQTITERLVIEDAWFRSATPKYVNITMTNVGRIDLEVKYVQINGVSCTVLNSSDGSGVFPEVEIQETKYMNVYLDWATGQDYTITVTTDRGNSFESVFVSPS